MEDSPPDNILDDDAWPDPKDPTRRWGPAERNSKQNAEHATQLAVGKAKVAAIHAEVAQITAERKIKILKDNAGLAKKWIGTSYAPLIIVSKNGEPAPLLANAITILGHATEWKGSIGWNDFHRRIECIKQATDERQVAHGLWTDAHDAAATEWIQQAGVHVPMSTVRQAVATVAQKHAYNPLTEWLNTLEWDGTPRIDTWLLNICHADDNDYVRAVGAKFLIGAIARAYVPGCKQDTALVLEGLQGIRKSTTFEILAGDFFSDDMGDLHSKDAAMQSQAGWIIELAELSALTRSAAGSAGIEGIKAFLTRRTDRFRPPYGHNVIHAPRQSVFVGTVNPDGSGYLRDQENRRFWPVRTGNIDTHKLSIVRDQLWAEAITRYRENSQWWLTESENRAAQIEQESRRVVDEWQHIITRFTTEFPQGDNSGRIWWVPRSVRLETMTVSEILTDALNIPVARWTQNDQNRVARCLKSMGWIKRKMEYIPDSRFIDHKRSDDL